MYNFCKVLYSHTLQKYVKEPKYLGELKIVFYSIFTLTHLVFGFLIIYIRFVKDL